MSEENRPQQSSAESTVAGAAKTGKAIASIAKGAATGGAHGAAVEAAKSSKKWIIPIVPGAALIFLPVGCHQKGHDWECRETLQQVLRVPGEV